MMDEVLVDQPLHPPRRDDGHGPHRTDLLADLLERLQQPGIARALEHDGVKLLAECPHLGGGRLGPAGLELAEARLEALELSALEAGSGEPHRERLERLPDLIQLASNHEAPRRSNLGAASRIASASSASRI